MGLYSVDLWILTYEFKLYKGCCFSDDSHTWRVRDKVIFIDYLIIKLLHGVLDVTLIWNL